MPRKKPWNSRFDVDQYIKDLEDVYSIRIEVEYTPMASRAEQHGMYVTMKGFWKDEPFDDAPMAYLIEEIVWKPSERFISTMIHALTLFTYQCVEAHISALHQRN